MARRTAISAPVKQPLMIERREKGTALVQRAQAIEAHGIEPLEDVAILTVLRRATVLFDEPLNFLEARDDPFLARRAAALLFGLERNRRVRRAVRRGRGHS